MIAEDEDSSEKLYRPLSLRDDLEALKHACLLAGTNQSNLQLIPASNDADNHVSRGGGFSRGDSASDDSEDDFQFLRDVLKRFGLLKETEGEPFTHEPTYSIPPVSSENDDDDFETLRAIQRRFAASSGDHVQESIEKAVSKSELVGVTNIDSEKETSGNCFGDTSNAWEGFPGCVDETSRNGQSLEACNTTFTGSSPYEFIDRHNADTDDSTIGPVKGSRFPESAQAFIYAIKKSRSCQQLIRSRLTHIEAAIKEINLLKDRLKILNDFQVSCKVRTARALSQKKDARVQLISAMKPSKVNGMPSAMHNGPAENSQVSTYREALNKFPVSLTREKWSDKEKKSLANGVRQEVMLLQKTIDLCTADVSSEEYANVDGIDITPENMKALLPMVKWNELALKYVPSRSGAECQARWLNFEDPLINHSPWSAEEDKNLLQVVTQNGLNKWIDTATHLGTNRTPFQCLARYQRSLNATIIKREWTKEEDNQLRAAVEAFGQSDWQAVASTMDGRTGPQCSNRWIKTLHPAIQKKGKWTSEEDERLKVAVMLFGPKTWRKVADHIPGRNHAQCRERWVNSLDPSLNHNDWTEEEDLKLKKAILEHKYCWAKVATCVAPRTDNQCWRRWKVLFPDDVLLHQAARNIKKAALISNFVDRESERSSLGPGDFVPPSEMDCMSQLDDLCNEEVPGLTNDTGAGNSTRNKRRKLPSRKKQDTLDSMYIHCEKGELETECPLSSLSDVSLPNGEVGGNNEDVNCHKRASKLTPRRRKCLDRQENEVVEKGEVEATVQNRIARNKKVAIREAEGSRLSTQNDIRR